MGFTCKENKVPKPFETSIFFTSRFFLQHFFFQGKKQAVRFLQCYSSCVIFIVLHTIKCIIYGVCCTLSAWEHDQIYHQQLLVFMNIDSVGNMSSFVKMKCSILLKNLHICNCLCHIENVYISFNFFYSIHNLYKKSDSFCTAHWER